jgi:hypothetical protein
MGLEEVKKSWVFPEPYEEIIYRSRTIMSFVKRGLTGYPRIRFPNSVPASILLVAFSLVQERVPGDSQKWCGETESVGKISGDV